MHPIIRMRRLLVGLAALTLMVGGTAKAQPVDRNGTVIVPIGGAVRLSMKSKKLIKQVFNPNPNIVLVEADAANPGFVILRGLAQGTSRIELLDEAGTKEAYEVVVQPDVDLLRNILKRAVPTANVEVIPFPKGVILTGAIARGEDADTVIRVASSVLGINPANVVNAMTVGGVQQVQLNVIVARVDRTRARNRGFNFIVSGNTFQAGSILGGLASVSGGVAATTSATAVGITSSATQAIPTTVPNIVFGVIPANFQGLLEALTTEGITKLIAEPKLVTQSGRPAHFLSGGQQAIISASSGITGPGVAMQPFGTSLDFLPIVYGNGKIYLEVSPDVSAVDTGLGITTTFGTTPGFDEQKVQTSVVLESGQTFAVGGLIQTTLNAASARVPVLGEIPFIAPFFSQQTDTLTEQELVILVTPFLVDPMDCSQVPRRLPGLESRSPDDFEFYMEGIIEMPRGQRNVFENKHYKAAWKNDPSAVSIPCATFNPDPCGKGGAAGGCANGTCNAAANVPMAAPAYAPASAPPSVKPPAELPPAVVVPPPNR